jgi:hypothetical protein
MGAGKYDTGAQITQTIFGISRVQVIAAAAAGALICASSLGSRDVFTPGPGMGARDHVYRHVTKHEPRRPSFGFTIWSLVVVVTHLSSCSRVFSPRDVLRLQSLPS